MSLRITILALWLLQLLAPAMHLLGEHAEAEHVDLADCVECRAEAAQPRIQSACRPEGCCDSEGHHHHGHPHDHDCQTCSQLLGWTGVAAPVPTIFAPLAGRCPGPSVATYAVVFAHPSKSNLARAPPSPASVDLTLA